MQTAKRIRSGCWRASGPARSSPSANRAGASAAARGAIPESNGGRSFLARPASSARRRRAWPRCGCCSARSAWSCWWRARTSRACMLARAVSRERELAMRRRSAPAAAASCANASPKARSRVAGGSARESPSPLRPPPVRGASGRALCRAPRRSRLDGACCCSPRHLAR